jgi:hypothetical protein
VFVNPERLIHRISSPIHAARLVPRAAHPAGIGRRSSPRDSANIRRPTGVPTLARSPKSPIVLLTLLALLIAQAAAGVHLLSHLGQRSDPSAPQGQHAPPCLECGAYAPLGALHSGGSAAFAVAAPGADGPADASGDFRVETSPSIPFRSRAPPR